MTPPGLPGAPTSTATAATQAQDINKLYQDQGPFKGVDYSALFSQFKIDTSTAPTTEPQDFTASRVASEAKRYALLSKSINSDIKRMKKERDHAVKRAAGLTTCPAIATADAALASVQQVADLFAAVTKDNLAQAQATEQQLGYGPGGPGFGPPGGGFPGMPMPPMPMGAPSFGAPSSAGFQGGFQGASPSSFLGSVVGAVGQMGMCEALTGYTKEIERFSKDLARAVKMLQTSGDKETLAKVTAIQTKIATDKGFTDPFGSVDFNAMEPGVDPIRDLWDNLNDTRRDFDDAMQEASAGRSKVAVCGKVDQIKEFTKDIANQPEGLISGLAKAEQLCALGDEPGAGQVLADLEQYGPQLQAAAKQSGVNKDDLAAFKGLSKKDLIAAVLNDPEAQDQILKKFSDKIEAMVNEKTKDLMAQIAKFSSKYAADTTITAKQGQIMDVIGALDDKNSKAVADGAKSVAAAISDVDTKISDVKLPAAAQTAYKDMLETSTAHIMTPAAHENMVKEFNALSNEIAGTSDAATIATAVQNSDKAIKAIYEGDKANVISQKIIPFTDVVKQGNTNQWYIKDSMYAYSKDLVKGDANGNLNATATINNADAVTILGRAIDPNAASVAPDTNNPLIKKLPAYAQGPATVLEQAMQKNGGDFSKVLVGNAGDPMLRKDMFEAAGVAFGLQGSTNSLNKFSDAKGLTPTEQSGAAALVQAGIVSGQGAGNSLDPNGVLNKAAFIKIINKLTDTQQQQAPAAPAGGETPANVPGQQNQ